MWRWRSIRRSIIDPVAVLCAVCVTVLGGPRAGAVDAAGKAQAAVGPTSPEEAATLKKEYLSDLDHGMDEDAIPKLERYVARYPGYPDYLEARHLLGQAYLRQHRADAARTELRAFIEATGKTNAAVLARLELTRAELDGNHLPEALLTAAEAVNLTQKAGRADGPALHAEALILQARAALALKQERRARDSVSSALKEMPAPAPSPLVGEAKVVELEVRLRRCSHFPSSGKLAEAQVRNQLGRMGTCLLDALLVFQGVLSTEAPMPGDEGVEVVSQAYETYWEKCKNPPPPPPIKPRDRNAAQLKTYFRELTVVLKEDCRENIRRGKDLLMSATTNSNETPPAEYRARVRSTVAALDRLQ